MSKILRRARRNPTTLLGLVLTVLVVAVAVFAPALAPRDPLKQTVVDRLQAPSAEYLMGTDRLGRDILSRTIYGARVSLIIGISSVLFGAILGTLIGVYATLRRGALESAMLVAIDLAMSIPTILLCMMLLLVLGQGASAVIIAIGVALTPRFARLSRGPTLAIREGEFVEAAHGLGARLWRVTLRHVLPNIIGPVSVMAVLWTATAIRIEASLSFLGFGVQPPTPTWGNMIEEGFRSLSFAPYVAVLPGIAILTIVMGLNLLGDGLRDIFDPRFRE